MRLLVYNIRYATGSRNMAVWTLHNAARYAFVPVEGPVVLFDGLTELALRYPLLLDRPAGLLSHTFGWAWDKALVRVGSDGLATLPEHFVAITDAMNSLGGTGLWDETDGFYFNDAGNNPETIGETLSLRHAGTANWCWTSRGCASSAPPDTRRCIGCTVTARARRSTGC